MSARVLVFSVLLAALPVSGCLSPIRRDVDDLVCHRAEQSLDLPPSEFLRPPKEAKPAPPPDGKKPTIRERLEVPESVPGSNAPKMSLPKNFKDLPEKEKEVVLAQYFKSQMEVGKDPAPIPGPEGRPLTLTDLQKLARAHSPLLIQAAADIKGAEGLAIQAGVYPNPVIGYTSTQISFTSGQTLGPNMSQTIVTMGKRTIAEAAARMDLENAKLAYRRAETDVMAAVRSAYFAVLVAEEGMKANRGLMALTDEVYKVMLIQLKKGQLAMYEPAQLGVYAGQARIGYIQSRNAYLLAWKNLATAIGLATMPVTQVAGSVTRDLPRFDFEKALAHVLRNHTDALTAENTIKKARYNLRLAEVTAIPDITVGMSVLYDGSLPGPPRLVPNFIGSMPLPVFDRNQGNLRNAQAGLMRAIEEPHRVQNALTSSFAEAYKRLEENRQILLLYRKQLLQQQVQAFRATVLRYFVAGPIEIGVPGNTTAYVGDLIVAEQNLVGLIGTYLVALGSYWQAASDTASLLQTDDVYEMASEVGLFPESDLSQLLQLPCCHPCSSLPHALGAPEEVEELPPPKTLAEQSGPEAAAPVAARPAIVRRGPGILAPILPILYRAPAAPPAPAEQPRAVFVLPMMSPSAESEASKGGSR